MKKLLCIVSLCLSLSAFGWSVVTPTAADSVFISQNCDPENDYSANRFTEIYNPSQSVVDLTGWQLLSIQNGEEKFAWTLSGTIKPGEALVCGFENHTSDVMPDFLSISSNTSWNGGVDDGAVLKRISGAVQDYAVGLKFENKQMVRNANIVSPNSVFDASQWTVSGVFDAKDATPGVHLCDLPIIAAPIFTDLSPSDVLSVIVGDLISISATVKTEDATGIDSVVFVYGTSLNALLDTMLLLSEVDTFYNDLTIEELGAIYGRLLAFGGNGKVTYSDVIEIHSVCGEVDIPLANAASDVSASSFMAHWQASADAQAYFLDVWTEVGEAAHVYVSSDFVDGVSPLPSRWSDNEKVYTLTAGFEGGKSLKLGTSSEAGILTSPSFSIDQNFKVIFYAKAYDTDEKSIAISYANQHVDIDTLSADWASYTVAFTAESGEQGVRFEAMRAYLDSVVIQTGGVEKQYVLQKEALQSTEQLVAQLENNTSYYYSVQAVNTYGCKSDDSNTITVLTSEATYLQNHHKKAEILICQGGIQLKVYQVSQLHIYEITGRQVMLAEIQDERFLRLKSGLYLVKIDDIVTKVAVK